MGSIRPWRETQALLQHEDHMSSGRYLSSEFHCPKGAGRQMWRGFDLDWFFQSWLPTWADLSALLCFLIHNWEGEKGGGIARGSKGPSSWLWTISGNSGKVTCWIKCELQWLFNPMLMKYFTVPRLKDLFFFSFWVEVSVYLIYLTLRLPNFL